MSTTRHKQPKIHILIGMLRRPCGATIPELVDATGWKPRSVAGAIFGEIKKRRMMDISSEVVDGVRTYRVVGPIV